MFDVVFAAIEIQGALEGLSARWAAERGTSQAQLDLPRGCLAEIESLLNEPGSSPGGIARYAHLNAAFHRSVAGLSCCKTLSRHTGQEFVDVFALPDVRRILLANPPRMTALLLIEQDQHHRIVEAIEAGLGAVAESLVREHARLPRRYLTPLI